ncbi:MAG TPA: biosynthetic-type acetolactate synthase large subunit [Clostridia bacterium]|nr:biosynthetic-type acetolactate synthase large subunit [Clostridia bacterium]
MEISAAEAIVRCLEDEKVELIFGYPGGAMLPVYDALYNTSVKHVLVRHEQGATHAANGYAMATGKVGVCMATSGPGATNLVTGIANAYMDSNPLVLFTGQVPTNVVGTDSFQEVDITGITMPVVKHNYLLKDPGEVLQTVKRAFHIASTGRPGPVLIDLPKDIASATVKYKIPENLELPGYKPTYKGHPAQIQQAAKQIMKSERPVIYAGGGIIISECSEELRTLAEMISAPVTTTLRGLGCFPGDHPLSVGMLGMHGTRYANKAVTNCDLLITLGARFDDRVTGKIAAFAPNAKVIHVDIDPAEIGKNIRSHLPIVGDLKHVLQTLLPLLKKKEETQWLEQVQEWKREFPLSYDREGEKNGKVKPQYLVEQLCEATQGDAIVVTDVGQHQMWVAQYYKFKYPRSFVTSGGLGCMGFGLPASIGAQLGAPDRKVIAVAGDGGFQMTMTELGTLVEQKLPIKIFIFNNKSLGMVRQLQKFYCDERYVAVDFDFCPDFNKLADVYGIKNYLIENHDDVAKIIPEALDYPGAVLVNCIISAEEDVLPMVLTGSSIEDAVD